MLRGIWVYFIGEIGVDGGGFWCEFYRFLVIIVCIMVGMLEGSDGRKVLMYNCVVIKVGKFKLLGMMVGMLMVDGGLGLLVFLEFVFYYIVKGIFWVGEVEDVFDFVVCKNFL